MDGIVYVVTVSLGFATYENYEYVHIFGKTSLILYKKENFKGDKMLVKYKDLKTIGTVSNNDQNLIVITKEALFKKCNWFGMWSYIYTGSYIICINSTFER